MTKSITKLEGAKITEIREFSSKHGYGLDIYLEAVSKSGKCYYQVVFYDDKARQVRSEYEVNDIVSVAGEQTVKSYPKKDGTTTIVPTLERPDEFNKGDSLLFEKQPTSKPQQSQMAAAGAQLTEQSQSYDEYGRKIERNTRGSIIITYDNNNCIEITKDGHVITHSYGCSIYQSDIDLQDGSSKHNISSGESIELTSDRRILKTDSYGQTTDIESKVCWYDEPSNTSEDDW